MVSWTELGGLSDRYHRSMYSCCRSLGPWEMDVEMRLIRAGFRLAPLWRKDA